MNLCLRAKAPATDLSTLSLHDALPIWTASSTAWARPVAPAPPSSHARTSSARAPIARHASRIARSEEHTSELQSRQYLVCRLLLEKKNEAEAHHGQGLLQPTGADHEGS